MPRSFPASSHQQLIFPWNANDLSRPSNLDLLKFNQQQAIDDQMAAIFTEETHRAAAIIKEFANDGPRVSIFGSARFVEGSKYYCEAYKLGRSLTQLRTPAGKRMILYTGAGPGVMDASSRGAQDNGGLVVGSRIKLPFEQESTIHADHCESFNYFAPRKVCLFYAAQAVLVMKGGWGTLDELFEACRLITRNQGFLGKGQVLLVGKDMWQSFYDLLKELSQKGYFNADELRRIRVCEDNDEALEALSNLHPVKIYDSEVSTGMNMHRIADEVTNLQRSTSELFRGLSLFAGRSYVYLAGGSTLKEGNRAYSNASQFGGLLGKEGANLMLPHGNRLSGLAADSFRQSRTARMRQGICAGVEDGTFTLSELGLTGEQSRLHREWIQNHLDVTLETTSLVAGKVAASKYAQAQVFCPGGFGTLGLFFEELTLAQCQKKPAGRNGRKHIPVICIGEDFWIPIKKWMKEYQLEKFGTISPHDLERFVIVKDSEEAFEIIKSERPDLLQP